MLFSSIKQAYYFRRKMETLLILLIWLPACDFCEASEDAKNKRFIP